MLEDIPRMTQAELEACVAELDAHEVAGVPEFLKEGLLRARQILATALHGVKPEEPCVMCGGRGLTQTPDQNGRYPECLNCWQDPQA